MMAGSGFDGPGRIARRLIAAAMLVLALPVAAAEADSRLCRQLEGQLAALGSGRAASSSQIRRYDQAIARQQQQLQRAREQAQQRGCGRFLSGIGGGCRSIQATAERMHANLVDLQQKRARMAGGNRGERARIMAALDTNRCRTARPAPQQVARQPRHEQPQREPAQARERSAGVVAVGRLSGKFRTMCVRTCDGYYFPVSYSVPQSAFERDAHACQAMCPGTQVELYFHRMPGQESEDMVSTVSGLPYREMENAFRYRRPGEAAPAGCGCEPAGATVASTPAARGFSVVAGEYGSGIVDKEPVEEPKTAAIPKPSGRPDPAEDPETLASRDGGLDADTLRRLATPPRSAPPPPPDGERQVRVVGPTFLPDPGEAIDLRAPDQNRAR